MKSWSKRRKEMNVRSKIESLKQNLTKADYFKTAALSGAMLLGGNASAQTQSVVMNNKTEITQEQSNMQGKEGKLFSLMNKYVCSQTPEFAEFCKENQIPNDGADYMAFGLLDNGLIIGMKRGFYKMYASLENQIPNDGPDYLEFGLVNNGGRIEQKRGYYRMYTILDSDEQGKKYDVTDKYLTPGFIYTGDFDASLFAASKIGEDGIEYVDHYIVFHKDKAMTKFSAEVLRGDLFRVTPKCIVVTKNVYLLHEKIKGNEKGLGFFAPNMFQEKMIYKSGKEVKLPLAFCHSQVGDDGCLITYPASEQTVLDFVNNGLFKDRAKKIAAHITKDYWGIKEGNKKDVKFFFALFNTPAEAAGERLFDRLNGFKASDIYNIDNLRKFCEDHKKVVNPLRTLVLTPEHFKNIER